MPHLFVAGLPASEAVDHILTSFGGVWEYPAIHMGSIQVLNSDPLYREEFLSMCGNPVTLAEAARTTRSRKQLAAIVTNPATPRTDKVEQLTKDLPEDLLRDGFSQQLASDLATQFDPTTHAELLNRVAADPEDLVDSFHGVYDPDFDVLVTLPDPQVLLVNHPAAASCLKEAISELREGFDQDLVLKFHGRNPADLTTAEKEELRRAGLDQLARDEDVHSGVFGHALSLNDLVARNLRTNAVWDAGHVADYTPVWVQEWMDLGLTEAIGVGAAGYAILPPLGRYLWKELSGSSPAMILAVDLLADGWKGTLQELVETVKATTA